MPTRNYPTFVEWQQRPSGSAWISVGDPEKGPHFLCDYLGDIEKGPTSAKDFADKPPRWVYKALSLDIRTETLAPQKDSFVMDDITRNRWAQLQEMHRAACFEAGDHPEEVDTAFSLGADAMQRMAVIDARAATEKECEGESPDLA
ncbi:hypothetical protein LCGC14_0113320 [marine sediment metagenome]|uniref:Uncharacterized protein n=2 Tax=root TaxID=1 RepID=A0A7V1BDS3_9RHOB|nr:hypothetical protein [Sulfitobacter litoralis]HDZ51401.1 hypothetical protein [Sulfitobacter litoralis]